MLHGNPSWSYYWRHLVLGLRDPRRKGLSLHRARPCRHGPVGQAGRCDRRIAALRLHAAVARRRPATLARASRHQRPGDAGGARLGRHDRLRLGAVACRAGEAAGDHQHRRVPVAGGQADAVAAVAGTRFAHRRLADPRASTCSRAARRGWAPSADCRRTCAAPTPRPTTAGATRSARCASCRTSRCAKATPAWPLVAEAGRRAARVRRSSRLHRLGPARFRVRPAFPRRLPRRAAAGARCMRSTMPAITCWKTSTKCWCRRSASSSTRNPLVSASRPVGASGEVAIGNAPSASTKPIDGGTAPTSRALRSADARTLQHRRGAAAPGARTPDQVAMRCPGRGGRYDVALTLRATRRAQRCHRRRPGEARHRARHAHGGDGAADAGVLPADVRAVQGRRGAGAGRSRHRQARAEAMPRRGAARSLHRHPAGACRARRARLGAYGTRAHHHRPRAHGWPTRRWRRSNAMARDASKRRSATGRHATRRRRRDPVHQRLDRRAEGRGLPASAFRRAGRDAARRVRHAGRRHRPADVPAVRAVRSGARTDLDHSRHGSDASGAAPIRASWSPRSSASA